MKFLFAKVLSLVSDNRVFIILYKELYFRHVYTRMQRGPSLAHRYDSYQNYQVGIIILLQLDGLVVCGAVYN